MKVLAVLLFSIVIFIGCNQDRKWNNLQYPEIKFIAEDSTSEGALLFNELVPNTDSLFNDCILKVCKKLYKEQSEIPQKKIFEFHLRNTQGVAATGGNDSIIDMFLNTNYVAGFYQSHNKDKKETLTEIIGVLIHELTHAYQHSPIGAGGYVGGSEHFSCIEGMADATRLTTGYIEQKFRKPGGHWNDGYKTTGFFIGWMMEQNPDFLYQFNQSTLSIIPWSWEKATQQIMNKSVADLWIAYQKELNPEGKNPVAKFEVNTKDNITDRRVAFKDNSEGDPFEWEWTFEGGIPHESNQRNPKVIYKDPGTYSVTLKVRSAFGNATVDKKQFLVVGKNPSGVLFSDLDKEVISQYKDSPEGEGVANVFDNSSDSKYLTYNNSAWIDFRLKSNEKFKLNKYCIVSANDSPERDPKEIVIKGSNDGKKWEVIDMQREVNFKKRFETVDFDISGKKAYSHYKIEMKNHNGPILQVADILLFGDSQI
nr:basic secretory protein-like protein [uncultured Carboxylicivirga sp.]